MEPLKDQFFNPETFSRYTTLLKDNYPPLQKEKMLSALKKDLNSFELKERLRNTTVITHAFLPVAFEEQITILKQIAPHFKGNFFGMVFPDFIELYGKNDLARSFEAMAYFTQYSSSEFAIRPFFKIDFDTTLKQMIEWSKSDSYHIRRFASEGSRSRLPWSFQLKEVIENPSLTQPILYNLKEDSELYVKKSVANHLNDISKDHPEYVIEFLSTWDRANPHSLWIMKQALRTLVKKGHKPALKLLGFKEDISARLITFELDKTKVTIGDSITFECTMEPLSKKEHRVVVDFAVHYLKKNGELSPKIFKLKDVTFNYGEQVTLKKNVRFEHFSTRQHYYGQHYVELLVNGHSLKKIPFELYENK